jgi:CheY-like chemotaxis protein
VFLQYQQKGNLLMDGNTMKLLIVEDNPSVRRILKLMAEPFADEILECADGEESIQIYRTEKPDFVLMDINLGKTDGINATRQIKNYDSNAKIIIVTSYDETDLRQAAAEAGAIGYVVKEDLSPLSSIIKKKGAII